MKRRKKERKTYEMVDNTTIAKVEEMLSEYKEQVSVLQKAYDNLCKSNVVLKKQIEELKQNNSEEIEKFKLEWVTAQKESLMGDLRTFFEKHQGIVDDLTTQNMELKKANTNLKNEQGAIEALVNFKARTQ